METTRSVAWTFDPTDLRKTLRDMFLYAGACLAIASAHALDNISKWLEVDWRFVLWLFTASFIGWIWQWLYRWWRDNWVK